MKSKYTFELGGLQKSGGSGDITKAEVEQMMKTKADVGDLEQLSDKVEEIKIFKYPNATIVGDLNISHGQVSGFSRDNYLVLPFTFDSTGKKFELNLAFTTGSDVNTAQNIIGSAYCMAVYIQDSKLTVRISNNGSSWDVWSYTHEGLLIKPNQPYYIKLSFDGINYSLKLSEDGDTYTTLSNLGATKRPYPGLIYLGVGNNFNNPFKGILNLNKCNLLFNDDHYWEGMDDAGLSTRLATDISNIDEEGVHKIKELAEVDSLHSLQSKVSDLETSKDLGVIVVGQPQIHGSQVSEFTISDYLMMPRIIEFGSNSWQLDFQFTTGNDVKTQQNIIDSEFGLALAVINSKIVIALSSTGTNWNLGEHIGVHDIEPNSSYYVRMTFDGAKYIVYISTDRKSYAQDILVNTSSTLYPIQIYIGKSPNNTHAFGGSIYLYYASLSINNETVWTGTLSGELKDEIEILKQEVSDLGNLATEDKTNLVAAINELVARVKALEGGGVKATFDEATKTINITSGATYDETQKAIVLNGGSYDETNKSITF